jgi:hypothetical protein
MKIPAMSCSNLICMLIGIFVASLPLLAHSSTGPQEIVVGGPRDVRASIQEVGEDYIVTVSFVEVSAFGEAQNTLINRGKARDYAMMMLGRHLNMPNEVNYTVRGMQPIENQMSEGRYVGVFKVPVSGVMQVRPKAVSDAEEEGEEGQVATLSEETNTTRDQITAVLEKSVTIQEEITTIQQAGSSSSEVIPGGLLSRAAQYLNRIETLGLSSIAELGQDFRDLPLEEIASVAKNIQHEIEQRSLELSAEIEKDRLLLRYDIQQLQSEIGVWKAHYINQIDELRRQHEKAKLQMLE